MINKLKKILIVAPIYPTTNDPGRGVFIKNFAIALEKKGIDVRVLAIRKSFLLKFEENKTQNIFEIYFLPSLIPKLFGKLTFFINKLFLSYNLKFIKGFSPDLIYSHFLIGSYFGNLISEKLEVPHYIGIGEDSNYLKSLKDKVFGKSFFNKIIDKSKLIISVSPSNMFVLNDFFSVSKSKLKVLPNAIDLNFFKHSVTEKISWGKNENFNNKFVICFIGDFNHRKGVHRLLSAVESLDDVM